MSYFGHNCFLIFDFRLHVLQISLYNCFIDHQNLLFNFPLHVFHPLLLIFFCCFRNRWNHCLSDLHLTQLLILLLHHCYFPRRSRNYLLFLDYDDFLKLKFHYCLFHYFQLLLLTSSTCYCLKSLLYYDDL
jgi:hypothetical protein